MKHDPHQAYCFLLFFLSWKIPRFINLKHNTLKRRLLTGWPCQYCSFNCYWQGHPVNGAFRTTADRVALSITIETVVLTGLPCQYCQQCIWIYVVDRVNNNQSGAKKCNQAELVLHRFYPVSSGRYCVIDRVTLSAVGVDVLLTGWPCQQWVVMPYWQGHPVSSGRWFFIDRVTLFAVGADVLLTGSLC